MTRIERFGWRGTPAPGIGRVVWAHGDYLHLVCDECQEGEVLARRKKGAFRDAAPPVTGDFVRFAYNPSGESLVLEVLPRFSRFERRSPSARRSAQTLAVNFDTLFVMMSLDETFSTPRLDRYLALAEDVGEAETVVVLTKADLPGAEERAVAAEGRGVPVLQVSCLSGYGMEQLRTHFRPGRTVALVGSSGVGKSTLVNTLAGTEVAATCDVQSWSGKGRHTTTSRRLFMLPGGSMVVDTPGVREIGFVGEIDAVLAKGESTHRWRQK